MSNKRPVVQIAREPAFAVPAPPLGYAELVFMQIEMGGIGPAWSVELHGFCAGEATLVLVPEDGDDSTGPSFMITRETYGLRMEQVHWDTLTEVGVFASLNDVLEAIRPRLAFSFVGAGPAAVTLH